MLPNNKAVGPDGVSAEAFKYCPAARDVLFEIILHIWAAEDLPASFTTTNFVILFKGKDSSNNPAKYRCIGLLNHAYKVLSHILLCRLLVYSDDYLQDWQAGFRESRDNAMILHTVCQRILSMVKALAIIFIDYSAAFDSVSHKFIDSTLADASLSNKLRVMFRVVYRVASAFTTVKGPDDTEVKSSIFPINRGVV